MEKLPKGPLCVFSLKGWEGGQKYPLTSDQEVGSMEMAERNFLAKNWEDFEAWIEEKIEGEISWKVKPRDTKVNRMIVAMSILDTIERNGGKFPPSGNPFIEVIKEERKPAPDPLRERSQKDTGR